MSPAGRPAARGIWGAAPPTENLNDFPPAGEAGGKIINDFLNDFPPAGRPAGENSKFPKFINVTTTTTAGL